MINDIIANKDKDRDSILFTESELCSLLWACARLNNKDVPYLDKLKNICIEYCAG